jgi:hypothetical protein
MFPLLVRQVQKPQSAKRRFQTMSLSKQLHQPFQKKSNTKNMCRLH